MKQTAIATLLEAPSAAVPVGILAEILSEDSGGKSHMHRARQGM